jgi:hypothetical protein
MESTLGSSYRRALADFVLLLATPAVEAGLRRLNPKNECGDVVVLTRVSHE